MIDLDSSPFPHYQLRAHRIVVASLVIFVWIKVRMVASLDPHVETSVVSPAATHQVLGCQVLFCLSFVHVKHEEKEFFWHFGNNWQINHFVSGTNRWSVRIFLSLLGRQVIVYPWNMIVGSKEQLVVDLLRLFCKIYYLFVHFLEIVLKDRVILRNVDIVEVLQKWFHVVLTEFSRRRDQPICQHGQLGDMELEEFDISLSFLVVFVVFFLSQSHQFLLNRLQTVMYPVWNYIYF